MKKGSTVGKSKSLSFVFFDILGANNNSIYHDHSSSYAFYASHMPYEWKMFQQYGPHKKIWLHKMISNCFYCFTTLIILLFPPFTAKKRLWNLFDTLFRFVCAINNRLGESFITNLLTEFIFNFPLKLLVIPSFLVPSIHCKFIDFPKHL